MTQDTKQEIRNRIKVLQLEPWSFDVEDQIATLQQQLNLEMSVPLYMRI